MRKSWVIIVIVGFACSLFSLKPANTPYELFYAASRPEFSGPVAEESPYASGEQMASFFDHLESVLRRIGFLHVSKHEVSILRRLHRIFIRAHLQVSEVHLLRGILTGIQRRLPEADGD